MKFYAFPVRKLDTNTLNSYTGDKFMKLDYIYITSIVDKGFSSTE
jgi:hypothetical protein